MIGGVATFASPLSSAARPLSETKTLKTKKQVTHTISSTETGKLPVSEQTKVFMGNTTYESASNRQFKIDKHE